MSLRWLAKFSAAPVLALLILQFVCVGMGCSGPWVHAGGPAGGQFGDTPTTPEHGFYATCTTESKGGHKGPWTGPLRAAKADAEKDGKDHESQNSGHSCTIVEY